MRLVLPWPPSVNGDVPGVYQIVDSASGMRYGGSAKNLRARFNFHVYQLKRGKHHNPIMQRIWAKDASRLSFAVLKEMPGASRGELLAEEQALLDALGAGQRRDCMNILPVAGSHLGAKRSPETCRRLAAANTGRKASDEARAKMRAAKLGKKQSPELVAKRTAAQRGRACRRPTGIINHDLRAWTAAQVGAMRQMRRDGSSWRDVAASAGSTNIAAVRRAVRGVTYRDVETLPCD